MADRKRISPQERKQRQAAARLAEANRKQRRGISYAVTIAVVAILGVFGVLGQNLSGNKDDDKTTPTTEVGQVSCPREDGTSPRQTYFNRAPGRCIDATRIYEARSPRPPARWSPSSTRHEHSTRSTTSSFSPATTSTTGSPSTGS